MNDIVYRSDVNRLLEDWFKVVFGIDSFRKTGLCRELRELPSVQPELSIKKKCTICPHCDNCNVNDDGTIEQPEPCDLCSNLEKGDTLYQSSDWDGGIGFDYIRDIQFCPKCGRRLEYERFDQKTGCT